MQITKDTAAIVTGGASGLGQATARARIGSSSTACARATATHSASPSSRAVASRCSQEQKERFLKPFLADHRYVMGRGTTEPSGGSDNPLPPPNDPKAGFRLRAEPDGDTWILNGEKCFIANKCA